MAPFSPNAQYHTFWIQHLWVVCKPYLHNVCGRPAAIFYSAMQRKIIPDLCFQDAQKETKKKIKAANKKAENFNMILNQGTRRQ
jgi:hypothetical protein